MLLHKIFTRVALGRHVAVVAVVTEDNDIRHAARVAARVLEWAAYIGPGEWNDEQIARDGHKLHKAEALPFFTGLPEGAYRR